MDQGPGPSAPVPPPYRPNPSASGGTDRGSSAGAWAAAAVVLGLGALVFAVLAHLRVSELEDRVGVLESQIATNAATPGGGLIDPGPGTVVDIAPTTAVLEQPTDAAAARADVIAAFSAVYDPAAAIDERVRLVDDPTGVAAAIRQAQAGPSGAAVSAVTVNVNDVQFSSSTRAKVVYGLTVPGQPPVLGRSGEARVAAGAWKVTRATVCADLSAVGGTC